ncbi:MAG: hypothetical protein ACI8WT_002312 [Clostridium sp.]|jgi:uncharacterized protein (TIGR01319 family)
MENAIFLDFGSTHTKIVVVSLMEERILHTACFESTVKTDARIGLERCFDEARRVLGKSSFESAVKLSSSSAAGGLRMAVVGLTHTLSIAAGRNTAFGAGAKIMDTLSGRISQVDVEEIIKNKVEIILFCGGYEKGNSSILIHNAHVLAQSKLNIPIIYAGNSFVAKEIRFILTLAGKECFFANNIIPNIGVINTDSAEAIVRDIFLKRIVNMKGLQKVKEQLDGVLMPTPSAVLSAGELLSKGLHDEAGLGELMIIDIGGATTDIHSYANQVPFKGARICGAAEKFTKRTVESDLGVRESSALLAKEIGIEAISMESGVHCNKLENSINIRVNMNNYLADSEVEQSIDDTLSSFAARIAARRHAGFLEKVHSSNCKLLQRGKNLSNVRCIVGTGGPIIHSKNPGLILRKTLKNENCESDVLLPNEAKLLLDDKYLMYSMGLLKELNPSKALRILKSNLTELI